MKKYVLLIILTILAAIGPAGVAQNSNSGHITGTVTDAQGAVIPGVGVTVTNVDTGVSRTFTTNSSGIYDAQSVLIGKYRVTFASTGFDTLEKDGVDVTLSGVTVDGRLTVGSEKQTVEVSTDAPLLQTESSEQSTTLEAQTISQLPDVGQDWANFTKMIPGAVGSGQGVAINGTLPFYASFQMDGANVQGAHSANVTTVVLETIAEVQIQTSTFSAQTGAGGATFNQITKSGTNSLHGALYEYAENTYFDAKNYFSTTQPVLHYNNYGGSVGGPIRKDKLFFYFNIDKIGSKSPSPYNNTFPLADAKAGDFSDRTKYPAIYDPATYNPATGMRQQISCNGVLNVICPNRINPVSAKIQTFYPTPNSNTLRNNTTGSLTQSSPFTRYFGRIDYNFTPSNRLTYSTAQGQNDIYFPNVACPLNCQSGNEGYYNFQVTDAWTINSNLVNEFRFGFSRYNSTFTPFTIGAGYPAQLGITYAPANSFPEINVNGIDGIGPGTYASYIQNSFDPSDVMTLIRGKHVLHFGGELLRNQDNSTPWGAVDAGNYTFRGDFTQQYPNGAPKLPDGSTPPPTGLGYADFLLGDVYQYSAQNKSRVGLRQWQPQLFVQDDIKLKSNLTLNAGVRYQIMTGWNEIHNRVGTFDPTVLNPATGTNGAMRFGGNLEANVYNIILPRVGFAWTPTRDGKTVFRGGYGLFAYGWSLDTYVGNGEGFGAFSQGGVTAANNITPAFVISDPNPPTNYVTASTSPSGYNGQGVPYVPYHTPVARNNQWNFSMEQQIPGSVVVQLAYVGSHAYNMSFPADANQVPSSKQLAAATTTGNNNVFRPFPQFSSIQGNSFNSYSNYDSLQVSATKRLSHGLSFDINYTWAKLLDEQDSSGWGSRDGGQIVQDAYNPHANYARSNFDVRHAFKGYALYQLPFGKGRMFLNNNTLLDLVLGGWQASTVFVLETGTPFTPTIGGPNQSGALAGNWFANVVGNPNLAHKTNAAYFNTAAFATPAIGTFGNAGRNSLQGPGLIGTDASAAKAFALSPLGERVSLQLKIDAQNVLNHPNFSNPGGNVDAGQGGGIISSTTNSYNSTNNPFGPRVMQLGARLSF